MSEHAQEIWAALTVSYFSFSWPLGNCIRLRVSRSSVLLVFNVEKRKPGSNFLNVNNHLALLKTHVCVRAIENNVLSSNWFIYRLSNNFLRKQ